MRYPLPVEIPKMPFEPGEIKSVLPNVFGKTQMHEAAVHILSFSWQINQWTGVSLNQLLSVLDADQQKHEKFMREIDEYLWAIKIWPFKCFFTLGLYALFFSKPKKPVPEAWVDALFSGNLIFEGIHELVEKEYLFSLQQGTEMIIYPTPKLVNLLIKRQLA